MFLPRIIKAARFLCTMLMRLWFPVEFERKDRLWRRLNNLRVPGFRWKTGTLFIAVRFNLVDRLWELSQRFRPLTQKLSHAPRILKRFSSISSARLPVRLSYPCSHGDRPMTFRFHKLASKKETKNKRHHNHYYVHASSLVHLRCKQYALDPATYWNMIVQTCFNNTYRWPFFQLGVCLLVGRYFPTRE